MKTKEEIFEIEDVLKIVIEVAYLLLINGAEVRRVEDTMLRICSSYKLKNPEVFAISSLIIITATSKDGKTITQTKRVYGTQTNLMAFEDANALSREICTTPKSLEYVLEISNKIQENSSKAKWKMRAGYIIAASSCSMLSGGNFSDALSAIIVSLILIFGNTYILKQNSNKVVYTFSISFLMGLCSIVLVNLGIGSHVDKIIIGDIMLLIPGMALINSITDIFCGDLMTGTTRITESLLTAFAIAVGFLFAFILTGGTVQ